MPSLRLPALPYLLAVLAVLLGLAGCARPADPPIQPTAAPEEAVPAHDPLVLILGADERTATGGGLLPTAEAALARAIRRLDAAPGGRLGAADAARLLHDLDAGSLPVADAGGALRLLVRELARLTDAVQGQDAALVAWDDRAQRILERVGRQWLAARDAARRLGDPALDRAGRATLGLELAGRLQALLSGPAAGEADGSGSLLQLRDALGYAAAGDGVDWNCLAQPGALMAELQFYRETELFCSQRLAPYDAGHDAPGA